MTSSRRGPSTPADAPGILLNRGWRYDLDVWFVDAFLMRGQLRQSRHRVLELARIGDGQSLLDVGCGTGSLALLGARLALGAQLAGIDPAPRPLARAQAKAKRRSATIDFRIGSIDAIPYPDASFDAVTSTFMLHHLPEEVKAAGIAEIARVLKPGGRVVIADFTGAETTDRHHQHSDDGHLGDLDELLGRAGFVGITREQTVLRRTHRGFGGIALVQAEAPSGEAAKSSP